MNKRIVEFVEPLARLATDDDIAEAVERHLNYPRHANHGLEGIYAIRERTILVWRVAS